MTFKNILQRKNFASSLSSTSSASSALVGFVAALVAFAATGCDSEPPAPPTVSPEIVAEVNAEKDKEKAAETAREAAGDEYVLKEAGVGATGKGNYGVSSEYDARSIVTVPVSTYFHAQEMTVFDMQIPHALNLYQASEGRFPNSQEEFMSKIVSANQIVLPKLPDGDEYVYDVPNHTLMIKTKKNPQ